MTHIFFLSNNISGKLPKSTFIWMLVFGFFCLFLAIFVIFMYVQKVKREKYNRKNFAVKEQRNTYKVFYFWSHVVYLLIIFAAIVGTIVLLSVAFGSL